MNEVEHNIFDEFEAANHITLCRIYDTLLVLLRNVNPEDASMLAKMHEAGRFVSPPVAYAEDNNEENH